MPTRRRFLCAVPAAGLARAADAPVAPAIASGGRGRLSKPLVSHLGYRPSSGKHLLFEAASGAKQARVVRMHKNVNPPGLRIPLQPAGSDFGDWLVGDFSALNEPGVYRAAVEFQFFEPLAPVSPAGMAASWKPGRTISSWPMTCGMRRSASWSITTRYSAVAPAPWLQHSLPHRPNPAHGWRARQTHAGRLALRARSCTGPS